MGVNGNMETNEGSEDKIFLWNCQRQRAVGMFIYGFVTRNELKKKKKISESEEREEKRENVCVDIVLVLWIVTSRIELRRREFFHLLLLLLVLLSVICVYFPQMSGSSSSCIGLILWDFSSHSFFFSYWFIYIYKFTLSQCPFSQDFSLVSKTTLFFFFYFVFVYLLENGDNDPQFLIF